MALRLGEHHQHLPQIVSTFESCEATVLDATQEIAERRKHHVLFIGYPARQVAQFATGQPDESLHVPLPEFTRSFRIARLELFQPDGYRLFRGR